MPKFNLSDKLKNVKNPHAARKEPLWTGPDGEGPNGGVTQGLLGRFLTCRERTRLMLVEGVKPHEGFNARTEYGSMWHVCEEALAVTGTPYATLPYPDGHLWERPLTEYCKRLRKQFPFSQEQIAHWHDMCKAFFPLYVDHWSTHPDVLQRTPLLQEVVFDVPYRLPSGRRVRLRGKWDSVDLIGSGKGAAVFLQENKTKSTINQERLVTELGSGFELQTMFYLTALTIYARDNPLRDRARAAGAGDAVPIAGVRYNVIRRPAHKTVASALKKFHEDAEDNRLGEWFARFKVNVGPKDVERFRRQCLDPLLEQLCEWWEWVKRPGDPFVSDSPATDPQTIHWRSPYYYNPLSEGAPTDLDAYLDGNTMAGLERTDVLYPELQEGE